MKKEIEWVINNGLKRKGEIISMPPDFDTQYDKLKKLEDLELQNKKLANEVLKLNLTIKKKDLRIKQIENYSTDLKTERDKLKELN